MIPYGRQDVTDEDISAVVDVLRSDFLTQGPAVPRFEDALLRKTGARHAVAMNSATSALHAACVALGVGPGDVVWTSPITFVASANCAIYCGAGVDFVDIDPVTVNLCPAALAKKLNEAAAAGTLPKLVIAVHMAGQSPDMEEIAELCRRYSVGLIEDASHAIGASYRDSPVGSCRYSDVTIFSFHPVKIVTTGEGGAALTNDPAIADRMRLFRSHGITRDAARMEFEPHGPWYYEQISLGYNYRLTDIQAALGVSQLERLEGYVEARHRLADAYDGALAELPLFLPPRLSDRRSAMHLYVVQINEELSPRTRSQVFESMRAAGIGVNVHYIPVHLQPFYRRRGFNPGAFPVAERYYERCISLPMFSSLRTEDLRRVVDALREGLV